MWCFSAPFLASLSYNPATGTLGTYDMRKSFYPFKLFTLTALVISASAPPLADTDTRPPSSVFFDKLVNACGQTFVGKTDFPIGSSAPFFGEVLTAHIASCSENELRIPFSVGKDTSRTWLITKTEDSLLLKHDHRHEDGTPDAVSMYGGPAQANGDANRQSFAADAYTAELVPEAATNVWTIQLSEDGTTLTYSLTRDGKPRFAAALRRQSK